MLLLKSFKDDGDELNVAVPDEIRNLVCRVAPVPPADTSCLLCLHVVLQLPVGGVDLLQKLRPIASKNSVLNSRSTIEYCPTQATLHGLLGDIRYRNALWRRSCWAVKSP